jgi:hypothetical protein
MTLPTYHVYHDTAKGRLPFTYFVFGPYSNDCYDVEIHRDHIEETDRIDGTYVGTVSDLPRKTHIVMDVWDWMDAHV